ncbi:hypothetical protein SP69_03465, partial [Moraxella catarrhalis]
MLPASQRFPAALADRQPVKPAASLWEVLLASVSPSMSDSLYEDVLSSYIGLIYDLTKWRYPQSVLVGYMCSFKLV